jgi:hypothetical protein
MDTLTLTPFVILAEGPDMFTLRDVAVGGGSHQAICPLRTELMLVGCLGVEHRKVGIAIAEDLCEWRGGGISLAEGLRD